MSNKDILMNNKEYQQLLMEYWSYVQDMLECTNTEYTKNTKEKEAPVQNVDSIKR